MSQPAYLEFRNQQRHPIRLFIEPWCEEYFLLPGAKVTLESVGEGKEVRPYFGLDFQRYQVIVWAEGGINDVRVSQDGEPLEIQHHVELWRHFCLDEGVDPDSGCKLETEDPPVPGVG